MIARRRTSTTVDVEVMAEYFETMRKFLETQERVMCRLLEGAQLAPRAGAPFAEAPPRPVPEASAPSARESLLAQASAAPVAPPPLPPVEARPAPAPMPAPAPAPKAAPAPAPAPKAAEPSEKPQNGRSAPAPAPKAPEASGQPQNGKPAPAANGALGRGRMREILLAIVEEKTGYPPDMVGMDQNLEADLGIDSIKKVEIVGALVKALPPEYAKALGEDRGRLTQPTLNAMLDILESLRVGGAEPAPAAPVPADLHMAKPAAPAAAPAVNGGGLGRARTRDMLLAIVEEKTGYPPDMVGMDQNLEADLGIDSIKKVEIVGALVKALPPEYAKALGEDRGRLTQPTLSAMLDVLDSLVLGGQTVPFEQAETGSEATAPGHPFRYVIESGAEAADARAARRLAQGRFLIAADGLGVAAELAPLLERRGCEVELLAPALLGDPDLLRRRCAELFASGADIAGVVHLTQLSAPWLAPEGPSAAWRAELRRGEESLSAVLSACAGRLRQDASVLCASGLGGRFGRGGMGLGDPSARGLSVQGGAPGLLKSLREERPGLRVKAVDLDLEQGPAALAAILLEELELAGGRQEVGYPAGRRTIFRTVAERRPAAAGARHRKELCGLVVLATGGLRGITAELLRELALPGNTLLVTGRSRFPGEEAPELRALPGAEELRRHFIAEVRAGRLQLTPAEIQRRIQGVLAAREMRANLADLRGRGAAVEYFPVDVTDEAAVAGLFADIGGRHGAVNGVVHGAGVLEDMLLENMTSAAWSRVVDTKVAGLLHLQKHLDPGALRFFAVLSSVAGRYGNSGQTSYATANELMNRLCCQLRERWQGRVRVKAFCWGPWGPTAFGAGMVTEETEAKFARKGVHLVAAEDGRGCFAAELTGDDDGAVEIICGVGPWEERESELGRIELADPAPFGPLLEGALVEAATQEKRVVSFELPASHIYLQEHKLDGKPILPAAAAVELMAEAAELLWPGWRAVEVRDVRALKGIEVTAATGRLAVVAGPTPGDSPAEGAESPDGIDLKVAIQSAKGVPRMHYDARVRLARRLPEGASRRAPAHDERRVTPAEAYAQWLIHGPRLQVIERIDGLSPRGVRAQVRSTVPGDWIEGLTAPSPAWRFDPALVDAAAQMAWIWSRAFRDETALPARFARVVRHAESLPRELTMDFEIVNTDDPHRVSANVFFLGADGRVLLAIEGLESVSSAALNRLGKQATAASAELV